MLAALLVGEGIRAEVPAYAKGEAKVPQQKTAALAPGQVLFDFGNGPVATTLAVTREWAKNKTKENYATRKAQSQANVAAAVAAAVAIAEDAFALANAGQVVDLDSINEHERNLKAIIRTTRHDAFGAEGYGVCEAEGCDALTSPTPNGKAYRYCRPHQY